jgi:hypothetical protein
MLFARRWICGRFGALLDPCGDIIIATGARVHLSEPLVDSGAQDRKNDGRRLARSVPMYDSVNRWCYASFTPKRDNGPTLRRASIARVGQRPMRARRRRRSDGILAARMASRNWSTSRRRSDGCELGRGSDQGLELDAGELGASGGAPGGRELERRVCGEQCVTSSSRPGPNCALHLRLSRHRQ